MKKSLKGSWEDFIEQAAMTGFFRLQKTLFGKGAVARPTKIAKVVNVAHKNRKPAYLFDAYEVKGVDAYEIMTMAEKGLLGLTRKKGAEILYEGLNLLNMDRILFVKILQEKFQIPVVIIRQIIEYEKKEVMKLVKTTEPYFKSHSVLGIFKAGARHRIQQSKKLLAESANADNKMKTRLGHDIQELDKWLTYLKKKKWRNLKTDERYHVAEKALSFVASRIVSQLQLVSAYRDWVLQGYSPQVEFFSFESGTGNHFLSFGPIDWEKSLTAIEEIPWLTFFRTPDFEVYVDKGHVHIAVFSPDKITTKTEWERIRAIYTRFRKRLRTKRKPYGTLTGLRERLAKVRAFIKEDFWKIREQKPNIGAYEAWDLVNVDLKEKFGLVYSPDTLRRYSYPRKSVENKSTRSKHSKNK